jgi:predicted protein tyrosine phosphatase
MSLPPQPAVTGTSPGDDTVNVLVICSRNQWRSPTAETLINARPGFKARSAGTSAAARVRVNERHLAWADVILVMEFHHATRLREQFGELLGEHEVHCLDVPDEYRYMDPDLIELLQHRLNEILGTP